MSNAIYARQSVDKKDSLSIEGQIEQCKSVLFNTPYIVYSDKGYSGKNTERPDLLRLIQDIELDKIKKVVVYKLDRISRNITDFYKLYEVMEKHKCEFVSASECFDTSSAMGKAMMGILAIFAQMERENIQKRVKDNYYYRTAETGAWAGGPAPYGYMNGRNKDGKPTLIKIPKEIEAIEFAFALYEGIEHCTLGEVAWNLNQRGYKPRKKPVFDSSTVSKILQNPIYVCADSLLYSYFKLRGIKFLNDKKDWTGYTSAHIIGKRNNANIRSYSTLEEQSIYLTNFPGFIKSVHYIAVQDRLSENQQFTRNNTRGALEELGGKLKCKSCGYAIKSYSRSTNDRPYLDCYGNRTLKICKCKFNKVNFYELQDIVGNEIQKQLDKLKDTVRAKIKVAEKMTADIDKKKEQLDKIILKFSEDEITAKAIERTVKTLQKEIDELEYKQKMSLGSSATLEIFFKHNLLLKERLVKGVEYIDLYKEEKREVINLLIDKIYLTNDINDFEIVWKI